jgi:hypothetical protein
MNWLYQGVEVTEIPDEYIGFIYLITELTTGKKYIGKKKCWFKKTSQKTVTLKNGTKKKKKIRSLVPSDWMTYYGSSEELKKQIELNGIGAYKREIVKFCVSETELTYFEAKLQFETDCLLKPDEYYNSWIMCRCRRSNLKKL